MALAARGRITQARERDVDAERRSELAQHRQVVSGAAAAIERPQVTASGGGPLEQRRHETAEATKPEVITLGPGGRF